VKSIQLYDIIQAKLNRWDVIMHRFHIQPERKILIHGNYQVIVVGGGTGGICAAVAAARQGMNTLLIESMGFLGGSQTAALVTPMMGIMPDGSSSIGGINEEIRKKLLAAGDGAEDPGNNNGWFNPEGLKFILDDLCEEAGVNILFHTVVSDVILENNHLKGLVIENKSGTSVVMADRIIDASGDADIAVRAGAPFIAGREEDGMHQAMSLRFNMAGIDLDKFCEFLNEKAPNPVYPWKPPFVEAAQTADKEWPFSYLFRGAIEKGELTEDDAVYFQIFGMPGRPGEMSFNCPRISSRVDGTNVEDLSFAQLEGRRKIRRLAAFCRKYLPGWEESYIAMVAPMVGVRETRRIIGEYVFTGDDVAEARKFDDAVARGNYPMDIHNPSKGSTNMSNIKPGEYYELPLRVMIPKSIDNLLVVGRCISATFEGQSAIRVQGIIRTLGEAAGYAMAVSIKDNLPPSAINVKKVRSILKDNGVTI
jgi:FAD dependent oxidoreductase